MVGLGRGGAGGVVQFFDKAVVALGTLVVAVQLLDKALTCPLLSHLGFVFFFGVKGVGDVLAGLCLGVYVFFVGVKGVADVLAGRSGALRSRQGRR